MTPRTWLIGMNNPYGSDLKYALFPSPSGLCQVWNDSTAYFRARQVLRQAYPELEGIIPP